MEDIKKPNDEMRLRAMSSFVQEGVYRGVFREFLHSPRYLAESIFNGLKTNHIDAAKEGKPFVIDLVLLAFLHDQKEYESKITVDVQIENGLFVIVMGTEEESLFSNSVFKTRSPIGLETYIQGNVAVWAQAFVKQVNKLLDTENENIRLKLEAEAIEKSKRRV